MQWGKAIEAGGQKKDLEALMGRARVHQVKEQYNEALDQLNQVIVLYAWFLPALVEKFGVLMAMGDWEQAVETAQRVLAQDQRAGASDDFLDQLLAFKPRTIVYVSCDPATLARDAKRLLAGGTFALASATPFDLFPMTRHVEAVVAFKRIN